ncbi:MAG: PRC-barrel domain-containing protein [Parvularcula sp.]|jgi:hypothetical protein|nr:PRC-barrel domain-containing protein [Parvularcula sp.]
MKLLLTTTAVSAMAFSLAAAQSTPTQDEVEGSEYLKNGYEEPAPVEGLDQDELDQLDDAEKLNAVVLDTTTEADDVAMPSDTAMTAQRRQTQPNASTTPDRPEQELRTAQANTDEDLTETQRRQKDALAALLGDDEIQTAGTNATTTRSTSTNSVRTAQTGETDDMDEMDDEYGSEEVATTASVNADPEMDVDAETDIDTDVASVDTDIEADVEDDDTAAMTSYADRQEDRNTQSTIDRRDRYASDDEAREGDMDTDTEMASAIDTDSAEDEETTADALTRRANQDMTTGANAQVASVNGEPVREPTSDSTAAPGDVFVYTRTVRLQPNALNADRLLDRDIYSGDNKEVASISDFIIDESGQVTEAVIQAGGLFGLGQDTYTIGFNDLTIEPGEDGNEFRISTALSEDEIGNLEEWDREDFVVGENGMTLASELRDAELNLAGTDETISIEDVVMNTSGTVRSVIVAYDGENYAVPYDRITVAEGDSESDVGYTLNTRADEFATMPIFIITPAQSMNRNMFERNRQN